MPPKLLKPKPRMQRRGARRGGEAIAEQARLHRLRIRPIVEEILRERDLSLDAKNLPWTIANELNRREVATLKNREWTDKTAGEILKEIKAERAQSPTD